MDGLLRHLITEALLLEDRRGAVVKRLGLPREFADYLHDLHPPQSHKYSYWMAEQFLDAYDSEAKRWLKQQKRGMTEPPTYQEINLFPPEHPRGPTDRTVNQGDSVASSPSSAELGKFVGITPGGTVWVSWPGNKTEDRHEQEYEHMVVRLKESWERHIVQGLTGIFERRHAEVFKKIFVWHEATGGGHDLAKLGKDKAAEEASAYEDFRKSEADGSIIMTFKDGYYWIDLQKKSCPYEAKHMGHCAEDSRGTLYSLRDKYGKPHVTTTVTEDGQIVQMKGKENKKPVEKYHKYIAQLLATDHISAVSTGEDTADFEITDLGEKPMAWLISQKPSYKYVRNPEQAILDYASEELTWEEFEPVAKRLEGMHDDVYHEENVEWFMDVEDMMVLFVSEEESEEAYKAQRKRRKPESVERTEVIQDFLGMIFRQDYEEMRRHVKKLRVKEDKLKPLVLAANDFLLKVVEQALDLPPYSAGLHYTKKRGSSIKISGRMSYQDLAQIIAGAVGPEPEKGWFRHGIGTLIYDYINTNNIRYDLKPERIFKVFEEFGYWYIKDFEMEWHQGHTVAVDATVEHTITGREKEVDDYVGVNPDVEFTQVTHEEYFGADHPEYDTPMRGRKAQQSVLLTATDEDDHTWQLQIELDPKTGEWDEDSFYDWECYDCYDEEEEEYE